MLPEEKRKYTYEDYMNTPEEERIEIIDGKVYNMAPPNRVHQEISSFLTLKIGMYLQGKTCKLYAAPFGVFLGEEHQSLKERHCVEPDISIICDKTKLIEQGCLGSPDFIIEIVSKSTGSHDYIRKLHLYNKFGVKEYWIVNPLNKSVSVYVQGDNGEFGIPVYCTFNDVVRGTVLESFSIDFSGVELE